MKISSEKYGEKSIRNKKAVLFDLGGTLVQYYEKKEFPGILRQAVNETKNCLRQKNLFKISTEALWQRVKEEDYEARDFQVRPLEERLQRIFQLNDSVVSESLIMELCRCFMKPIFTLGQCYEDTYLILQKLKARNFKVAIVSNTPWGSPANLWREEIDRLNLNKYVNTVVFCRDVGWRKPAKQIFTHTLNKLQINPEHCIFVGDNAQWDLIGPRKLGIKSILINRRNYNQYNEENSIKNLHELIDRINWNE